MTDQQISEQPQTPTANANARRANARRREKDRLRCYDVWLPDSVVDKLTSQIKVNRADRDVPLDKRTWAEFVGRVAAEAVKRAIKEKNIV